MLITASLAMGLIFDTAAGLKGNAVPQRQVYTNFTSLSLLNTSCGASNVQLPQTGYRSVHIAVRGLSQPLYTMAQASQPVRIGIGLSGGTDGNLRFGALSFESPLCSIPGTAVKSTNSSGAATWTIHTDSSMVAVYSTSGTKGMPTNWFAMPFQMTVTLAP
jgi:hypothetical protein